ncbi:hypothetical protein PoB_004222200 [Plakobranchus ocellatus]|uniref:Uncharacterized protein n=1 Tax=Plakobranchus ocellatus TaxID=259542 RepID=A0AAV4B943_9GAST|nr:hypothetical protein PoB_004222200 [Plakobranchus ocellatus]
MEDPETLRNLRHVDAMVDPEALRNLIKGDAMKDPEALQNLIQLDAMEDPETLRNLIKGDAMEDPETLRNLRHVDAMEDPEALQNHDDISDKETPWRILRLRKDLAHPMQISRKTSTREDDSFVDLGNIADHNGDTDKDVLALIGRARVAFIIMKNIWMAKAIHIGKNCAFSNKMSFHFDYKDARHGREQTKCRRGSKLHQLMLEMFLKSGDLRE